MGEDANNREAKEPRFASTERIGHYEHLFRDFFIDVLNFEPEDTDYIFVSNESSLWDFTPYGQGSKANRAEVALWWARIEETYGIDVSNIKDGKLVRIFERIATVSK